MILNKKYSIKVDKKRLIIMFNLEPRDAKDLYDKICIDVNKINGEIITLKDVSISQKISYNELLCNIGAMDTNEMDNKILVNTEELPPINMVLKETESLKIMMEEVNKNYTVTPAGKLNAEIKEVVIKVIDKKKPLLEKKKNTEPYKFSPRP